MSLYEVGLLGGLFGFDIRIIIENFHFIGKYDILSILFNMKVNKTIAFFGSFRATSTVIRLYPNDFFERKEFIQSITPLGEKCLSGSVIGKVTVSDFSLL